MRMIIACLLVGLYMVMVGCATNKPANPVSMERSWEYIGTNSDNNKAFIDPKTLTYSGSIVKCAWRGVATRNGAEALGQIEVDCLNNQVRFVNRRQYDRNHRDLGPMSDSGWSPIVADSLYNKISQKYCR